MHSIFAPDLNLTLVIQIPLVVFEEYYIEKNFITFSHDPNYCDKDMMGIMKEMYRAYVAKKLSLIHICGKSSELKMVMA